MFQHPPLSDEAITALYGAEYYDSWGEGVGTQSYWGLKRALFSSMADAANPPSGGAALDIGCATGACLQELVARGFKTFGIDINPHAVEMARKLVPEAEVRLGELQDNDFGGTRFSLIVLSDVVEHVRDPWDLMRRVRGLMAPDGVVVVLTPDVTSFSCRLLGRFWPHYKPEHLILFCRHSLVELLSTTGFLVRSVRPFAKPLTLGYAFRQLATYPVPLLTPISRVASACLPQRVQDSIWPLYMGETLAVAGVRAD